jgi:chemotaxis protein methyltransferase CheR
MDDLQYGRLKAKIGQVLKLDLAFYKDAQMRRRLTSYVSGKTTDPDTYIKALGTDPEESQRLKDFITINVTEFFRDKEPFDFLRSTVLPMLLKQSGGPLRLWSAGSSYGAEAYSFSMLLSELAPLGQHRIVGTDIDTTILRKAGQGGPYQKADLKNVPAAWLEKHFTTKPDGFYVNPKLKTRLEFRQHDLLKDRYDGNFDLVACRNVVIYFTDEAKENITRGFVNSLKPGGVLFIGATEALLDAKDLGLKRLGSCFYQKVGVPSEVKAPGRIGLAA